jgi:hypothetical protein
LRVGVTLRLLVSDRPGRIAHARVLRRTRRSDFAAPGSREPVSVRCRDAVRSARQRAGRPRVRSPAAVAAASNSSLGSGVGVIFCALAHLSTSGPFRAGPIGDCRSRNVMRPPGSPYVHDPNWCNPAVGDRPRGQRSAGFRSPAWAATPPRSMTLLVWTKGSSVGAGLPWPARDTSFSSAPVVSPRPSRACAALGGAEAGLQVAATRAVVWSAQAGCDVGRDAVKVRAAPESPPATGEDACEGDCRRPCSWRQARRW